MVPVPHDTHRKSSPTPRAARAPDVTVDGGPHDRHRTLGKGMLLAALLCHIVHATALVVCGVEVPHARPSPASRALDVMTWPEEFPFSERDLTPEMAGNDGMFYFLPKFAHHAGEECRASLSKFYGCVLPPSGEGDVLDLCSSFTSHYPDGWKGKRCVALGLNALELVANPSKTEWLTQDLNQDTKLPFSDDSFDVITNSLSGMCTAVLTHPRMQCTRLLCMLTFQPSRCACRRAQSTISPIRSRCSTRCTVRPLLSRTGR